MADASLILVYENASAFEALGALSALHAAGRAAELVARDALVPTLEGARIVPHRLGYDAIARADALVIPGGDVARPLRDAELARALRERRGKWTAASGAGIELVAHAGLADGRTIAGARAPPGGRTRPARLVADGRLLTCEPGDAVIDLALHLVAQLDGEEVAERAAHTLGREWRPFVMGAGERSEP